LVAISAENRIDWLVEPAIRPSLESTLHDIGKARFRSLIADSWRR